MGAGEPPGDELEDGPAESIRTKSSQGWDGNFVNTMGARQIHQSLKARMAFSADPKYKNSLRGQ